jgi:hypothetical protein
MTRFTPIPMLLVALLTVADDSLAQQRVDAKGVTASPVTSESSTPSSNFESLR